MFVRALGFVLGTNRVVGAQVAEFQGCLNVFVDAASHLDQAAERPFGVRSCPCRATVRIQCWPGRRYARGSNWPDSRIPGRRT